LLITGISYRTM